MLYPVRCYMLFSWISAVVCFSDHFENVALNKNCGISTTWNPSDSANAAVNNNTHGYYARNSNNCIHTRSGDKNPWWEVNLGRPYPVNNITIWARTGFLHRMTRCVIRVDGQECYRFSTGPTHREIHIQCTQGVLNGSVVKVSKSSSTTYNGDNTINICEVQVFSCRDPYWGSGCRQQCGQCSNSEVCDKVTGHCSHCSPGWTPPLCRQECTNGTFGDHCKHNCSEACQDVCDKVTGNCTCNPGWHGPTCDSECPAGTYDSYCSQNCSVHCNDTCGTATGNCTCRIGYREPDCTEECTDGTFGDQCGQTCSKGCQHVCDKVTGTCTCNPGWQGPACDSECTDGTFGDHCSLNCSEGCQGVCDKMTGTCTCHPGWQGPACVEIIKDEMQGADNIDIGMITGAAVAAVVVLVLVLLLVIFIIRRRRRSDKPRVPLTAPRDIKTRSDSRSDSRAEYLNQDGIYQNMLTSPEDSVTQSAAEAVYAKPMKRPAKNQPKDDNKKSKTKSSSAKSHRGEVYVNVGFTGDDLSSTVHLDLGKQNGDSTKSATSMQSAEGKEEVEDYEKDETEGERTGDVYKNERGVYYNDDVYMTSEGSDMKLDSMQQYLLDKLRGDDLDAEFETLPDGLVRAHDTGADQENYYRNRFRKILPYEDTRVVLRGVPDPGCNDYINASYIRGHLSPKDYIASQGPKTNTLGDFWKMVWQDHVTDIVMLTNIKEGEKKKCDVYWPDPGTSHQYGSVEVTGLEAGHRSDYVIRTFDVRVGEASRQVSQYHYVTWPDHGVPTSTGLVNLWRCVTASHRHHPPPSPLLVHCSAGVGRTGTYIALDTVMKQLQQQQQQQQHHLDILQIVRNMRHDRCNMIQTKSQYRILHEALLEAYTSAECQLPLMTFDTAFSHDIDPHHTHPHIDTEYKKLKQMKVLMQKPNYTEAEKEENINKNRAMDALPDDGHLARLTIPVSGRTDYINAVYLPSFSDQKGFILTQLPMPSTVIDLWRLVAGNDVTCIVSLGDIKDFKTNCYWPRQINKSETFGPITVQLTSQSLLGKHLIQYSLSLTCEDGPQGQTVKVLHYKGWPAETMTPVPDLPDPSDLADLVHRVMFPDASSDLSATSSPVLLQCTNGASKSGVFGIMCNIIRRMQSERVVDVYMAARQAQLVRPQCLTSRVQYRFIYQVVQEYKKRNETYYNA